MELNLGNKGALFDLDGVLVDTARYHYLAWKRLAKELGFDFTEKDNEELKGVSRMRSLEILLGKGGITGTDEQKAEWAKKKNDWYVEYLYTLDESALLPGTKEYLIALREAGIKISLGSASKNAPLILERLNITGYFDSIVDGNSVSKAKPDPEVFTKGADNLGLAWSDCTVYEDSLAGVQAATSAGMKAIGIGTPENLPGAAVHVPDLGALLK
ncbi:MAG: beta-phosphoglucomutase [Treponemataceae bacterium]|nr:beta-phosphoglucomutase [Treponemataceae bacterium]